MSPCPLSLAPPSHPPFPTPLDGHKAPSCSPCAMRLLPLAIYLTFGSYYMSMPLSHFVPASCTPTPRVLKSILYICVFIPVLPLGSSEPFCCIFLINLIKLRKSTSISNLLKIIGFCLFFNSILLH